MKWTIRCSMIILKAEIHICFLSSAIGNVVLDWNRNFYMLTLTEKSSTVCRLVPQIAKYKSSVPVNLSQLLKHTPQNRPGNIIKDKHGAFYVLTRQQDDTYWLSYHSISTADYVPENFIQSWEYFSDGLKPFSLLCALSYMPALTDMGKEVTTDFVKAHLICSFDSGIRFVKHNANCENHIGKILIISTAVKADIMLIVKASYTDIPLCKLKPLTMVERRNKEIAVVYSVEDDTSKFVMILTDKQGAEAVEVLNINHSSLKFTVHSLSDTGKATSGKAGQIANIAETISPANTEPVISREV